MEEILDRQGEHGVWAIEQPVPVYLTCYQVLRANGDPRAGEVLAVAHSLLQEWSDQIEEGELRRSFLENVPANREIAALFSAAG